MKKIIFNNKTTGKSWTYLEEGADIGPEEWLAKNTPKLAKPAVYESRFNEETGEEESVLVTPAEEFTVVETDLTEELAAKEAARAAKEARGEELRQGFRSMRAAPNAINSMTELRTKVLEIIEYLGIEEEAAPGGRDEGRN